MPLSQSPAREFTGKHFLIIMLVFFGTVIAVNGSLAYFAIHSWTGLVVPNSYVASQQFNAETARRQQAITNGAKAEVGLEADYVIVRLHGRNGAGLSAANLSLKVGHPVDASLDRTLSFTEVGAGQYRSTEALPSGTWTGEVSGQLRDYGDWVEAVRFHVGG